jgi:hypothetical protein
MITEIMIIEIKSHNHDFYYDYAASARARLCAIVTVTFHHPRPHFFLHDLILDVRDIQGRD